MPKLRIRAWRILKHPDTKIVLRKIHGHSAIAYDLGDNGSGGLEIAIDPYKVNIAEAVAHEIFHAIFDKFTIPYTTYEIHEQWYTALEKPFFKGMTQKEKLKWRKAIEAKMPKGQLPRTLKE